MTNECGKSFRIWINFTIWNLFLRFHPKISAEIMQKIKFFVFDFIHFHKRQHVHTFLGIHSFKADIESTNTQTHTHTHTHTLQVELEDVERTEWAAVKVKHDEDAGRTSMKIRRKKTEGEREQGWVKKEEREREKGRKNLEQEMRGKERQGRVGVCSTWSSI